MNENNQSSSKKINANGFKLLKHPTTISLPNIKTKEKLRRSSHYAEYINEKQIDKTYPIDVVEKWLTDFQTNKRVQFSRHVTVVEKKDKTKKKENSDFINDNTLDTLPPINQSEIISTEKENILTEAVDTPAVTITDSTFYRSAQSRSLSLSSVTSSTITHSHQSSFSVNDHQHPPSLISSTEIPSSIISSSTNKDRLPSLIFNPSLIEFDRKKLDDIRQLIPDQFEKLIPTLIKLGVIIWPQKFSQNNTNQQMTKKELIERHRLILLIKKDEEYIQHQLHLTHLYGNVLPKDDVHHKHCLLRESLSFHGQLSLLGAYRDQIERELTKKVLYWRSIPMQLVQNNFSDDSYSTNRSSSIRNNPKSLKSNINSSSMIEDESFQMSLPEKVDNQWQRKCLAFIIEQGMNFLDRIITLPQSILPNIPSNHQYIPHTIYDLKILELVREYKRWLFLWSILYTEDKCYL